MQNKMQHVLAESKEKVSWN